MYSSAYQVPQEHQVVALNKLGGEECRKIINPSLGTILLLIELNTWFIYEDTASLSAYHKPIKKIKIIVCGLTLE